MSQSSERIQIPGTWYEAKVLEPCFDVGGGVCPTVLSGPKPHCPPNTLEMHLPNKTPIPTIRSRTRHNKTKHPLRRVVDGYFAPTLPATMSI
jgi:hypothetical protein